MKKISEIEIVKRFNKKHNNKYDYSKINYVNYDTKLCIICPEHGEFWQTPGNHLNGKGCPYCAGNNKKTTEEFICDSKKIWGNRFDYSLVVYVNNDKPIILIDNKTGELYHQKPKNNLSGFDCTKNKIKTNLILKKFKEIHSNNYDYSLVDKNIKCHDKISIICPKHGVFTQTIYNHLAGKGCPKCGHEKTANKERINNEDFIEKAKQVHGNKYGYSKVNYINNHTKVCIICPVHGEFWQTPYSHLITNGCFLCYGKVKKTNKTFIEKAKQVHGDKYEYSKVNYINNRTKVIITCQKHGDFEIFPNNFLRGYDCRLCSRTIHKSEKSLFEILKNIYKTDEIIHSYHNSKILGKKELDIFFPEI